MHFIKNLQPELTVIDTACYKSKSTVGVWRSIKKLYHIGLQLRKQNVCI